MDVPPDALAVSARHLLRGLGYTAKPRDAAWGLDYNGEYFQYLNRHRDLAAARWKNPVPGHPPPIVFWYRESRQPLLAVYRTNTAVNEWDPPLTGSGMLRIFTDPQGRLEKLEAVPRQLDTDSAAAAAFRLGRTVSGGGIGHGAVSGRDTAVESAGALRRARRLDRQRPAKRDSAARGSGRLARSAGLLPGGGAVERAGTGQFLARGRATAACLPEIRGAGGRGGVCLAQREDRQG